MLYGLTIQEIIVLAAVSVGIVLLVGGLIFLFVEHKRYVLNPNTPNILEWDIPGLGKVKMNFAAGIALLVGGLLIGYPVWRSYDSPVKLPVSGKIELYGKPVAGIMVGVLSSSHMTLTQPDGRYSIDIPKGEKGSAFQQVVYVPNSNPPMVHFNAVLFSQDGEAKIDDRLP